MSAHRIVVLMQRLNSRLSERQETDLLLLILEHTAQPQVMAAVLQAISEFSYALIGGGAVSLYSGGRRRVSRNDLDLLVGGTDVELVTAAMRAQGFAFLRRNEFDGKSWLVFAYGRSELPDAAQEVDIALADDSLSRQGIADARVMSLGATRVKVVAPEVLMTMKIIAGREKDHRDILYVLKSVDAGVIAQTRKLVLRYAEARIAEFDQLVEDASLFDFNLLDQMG